MAHRTTFQVGDWVKVVGPCLADGRPRHFTRRIGRVARITASGSLVVHFAPVLTTADDWDDFWPAALQAHQPSRRREAEWLIGTLSR